MPTLPGCSPRSTACWAFGHQSDQGARSVLCNRGEVCQIGGGGWAWVLRIKERARNARHTRLWSSTHTRSFLDRITYENAGTEYAMRIPTCLDCVHLPASPKPQDSKMYIETMLNQFTRRVVEIFINQAPRARPSLSRCCILTAINDSSETYGSRMKCTYH